MSEKKSREKVGGWRGPAEKKPGGKVNFEGQLCTTPRSRLAISHTQLHIAFNTIHNGRPCTTGPRDHPVRNHQETSISNSRHQSGHRSLGKTTGHRSSSFRCWQHPLGYRRPKPGDPTCASAPNAPSFAGPTLRAKLPGQHQGCRYMGTGSMDHHQRPGTAVFYRINHKNREKGMRMHTKKSKLTPNLLPR